MSEVIKHEFNTKRITSSRNSNNVVENVTRIKLWKKSQYQKSRSDQFDTCFMKYQTLILYYSR